MIEFYLPIKWVHIVAIGLSGTLFGARGLAALLGAHWPYAIVVRRTSYAIDTVLLTAALMLVAILPAAVFADHWLTVKLVLIVVYIALGVAALRRLCSPRVRLACYVLALMTFVSVVGIAIAHHPLGWWWLLHSRQETAGSIGGGLTQIMARGSRSPYAVAIT